MSRLLVIRTLVVMTLALGWSYVLWRWFASLNLSAWWIAVPLVLAETYSLVDVSLFGITMWRARTRGEPPPPEPGTTVDVFITTYDEPIDLVMRTALAAQRIRYPHRTWILDDGARPALRDAALAARIGYLVRSREWAGRPRHAKAGNLNNALMATDGELILVLDADQVPEPTILDRTVGYFTDPQVAIVQTPQVFDNVPVSDPLGSQAPLFYGPIMQGKDGWNGAFFCGSNAVLRRDALMHLGLVGYVEASRQAVRRALRTSRTVLARAARSADAPVAAALTAVRDGAGRALDRLDAGEPLGPVTYDFQRQVDATSGTLVSADVEAMREDLRQIAELRGDDETLALDDSVLTRLAARDWSPLGALESVRDLLRTVDVDRVDEAQPLQPVATVSVTEDMATAMSLHALGWRTVYHHETLAHGLAPEDLPTMLTQRLRWAQGTVQTMLRRNPWQVRGLRLGQRLMYSATMWSYFAGFAAVVYLVAPVLFLCFGVKPVTAWSVDFFARFIPFLVASQLLFVVVARGLTTWRGQQYALALFPVWIRATLTAAANVWFGRPLEFAVTRKDGRSTDVAWRRVLPQLVAMTVLAAAVPVGLVRAGLGLSAWSGTLVNVCWVVYDLVVLSVVVQALRYRGYRATTEGEG
ncbi:Cellulose synthase (UDP-forming) [Cellulomonas flavigena DSM 20109]|uniref:Cellulose synthase (UDP-forming) n=1 Tax=Cellulomonas flavigena (strain ATCC 482 / DSM 20109 / BCRC 11376 / JCM 18109 / NBRC 3775 / NCIMB 8073 / NRS 134) TaxID=446466 RepID=D5UIT7_CELFN|nr:Cellulose synthase (UDP-forming) [Cellulomonas flavigena DSM 20109]